MKTRIRPRNEDERMRRITAKNLAAFLRCDLVENPFLQPHGAMVFYPGSLLALPPRPIVLTAPTRTLRGFTAALHEFGHVALGHRGHDRSLENEKAASLWAEGMAMRTGMPIDKRFLWGGYMSHQLGHARQAKARKARKRR